MGPCDLARAHGYSERAVQIVADLVRRRRPDARRLHVGPRAIEIEMVPGATVRMEHPNTRAIACPHYEPLPDSPRCRSFLPNGACARPDELLCVELPQLGRRAERTPSTPRSSP